VAELAAGRLEAARDALFDALALDPSDRPARFNLEWTLRALRTRRPPPAPEPQAGEPPPDPPSTRAEPEASGARRPLAPRRLGSEEARRWLDRIQDDPARALRSAVAGQRGRRRPSGPAW
jgi:hypothetical protein